METTALHKAQSVFNDIKGKDSDFQNDVLRQLHALIYSDRAKRLLEGADEQKRILDSLIKLNALPVEPEEVLAKTPESVKVTNSVPTVTTEQPSNETTSDPS